MTTLSEWFQEQEQEEREAERRANLDEWRRIAKMLRDLEYIKVPVNHPPLSPLTGLEVGACSPG